MNTNKGGYRRPEKSRKWDSFFQCMFFCVCISRYLVDCLFVFSRGHATLELAVSVGRSVGRSVRNISVFRSCPPVRDWGGVYTALFKLELGLSISINDIFA